MMTSENTSQSLLVFAVVPVQCNYIYLSNCTVCTVMIEETNDTGRVRVSF